MPRSSKNKKNKVEDGNNNKSNEGSSSICKIAHVDTEYQPSIQYEIANSVIVDTEKNTIVCQEEVAAISTEDYKNLLRRMNDIDLPKAPVFKEPFVPPPGVVGFRCPDNMNPFICAVQVITRLPPLRMIIKQYDAKRYTRATDLCAELHKIIIHQEEVGPKCKGLRVTASLRKIYINVRNQYDCIPVSSFRYFIAIMDQLNMELITPFFDYGLPFLNIQYDEPFRKLEVDDIDDNAMGDYDGFEWYTQNHTSDISELISSELTRSAVCGNCKKTFSRKYKVKNLTLNVDKVEKYVALKLLEKCKDSPCPPSEKLVKSELSMRDIVRQHIQPKPYVDKKKCISCQQTARFVNTSKISELPFVLTISVERFSQGRKNSSHISIPFRDLDLSQYTNVNDDVYYLWSLLVHVGDTREDGKYIAYCKNPDDHIWYEYDGAKVRPIDEYTLSLKEVTLAIYLRRNVCQFKLNLQEVSRIPANDDCYISKRWLLLLEILGDIGPISNTDYLCEHGGVHPYASRCIDKCYVRVTNSDWVNLFETFSGGPYLPALKTCEHCETKWTMHNYIRMKDIERLDKAEHLLAVALNQNDRMIYSDHMPANAISNEWYRTYQLYVMDQFHVRPAPVYVDTYIDEEGERHVYPTETSLFSREVFLAFTKCFGCRDDVRCTGTKVVDVSPEELEKLTKKVDEFQNELWRKMEKGQLPKFVRSGRKFI